MTRRSTQWLQALSALAAEGLEPKEAAALCEDIERQERSRAVRDGRGYRLLRLACGTRHNGPLGWLLRYAMGRALAAHADPERKPVFTLVAACTLLGERTGHALSILTGAGPGPLLSGLLIPTDDAGYTLAPGLAPWLIHGQVQAPGLQSLDPRPWLLEQPPLTAAAGRVAKAVVNKRPTMCVLTSTEPLLAAAVGHAIGQARQRPVRCWSLDDARRGQTDPLTALAWVSVLEDFDPMVAFMADEERGPWSDEALRPPLGLPKPPVPACLWIAVAEREPALPWLRNHHTSIDLAPLRKSLELPGQGGGAPAKRGRTPSRRYRRLFPGGWEGQAESPDDTELAATDRRLRLGPLQRCVFPDHDPDAEPDRSEASQGETEPHLAPILWRPSEQTLDHLVLSDHQHRALVNAAARVKVGERCVILLHGPPGSGKSMAARCLAGSAELPVYQLEAHLNRDMWFGEQDRKLAEIFEALAERKAVLVIDEADAWVGRRHGSAARVGGAKIAESSTLLLHLERYQGAAVLTTNRIETLDPALQRRVDLDLHLGLPELEERMALWSATLGEQLPLQADELCLLASVPLTGGDIVATVREAQLKQRELSVVALLAAARERAQRASLWG